jgi:hypothetical protein
LNRARGGRDSAAAVHEKPAECDIPHAVCSALTLKRADFKKVNRHRALASCFGMIFSENRFPLFRIMP